MKEPIEPSPDDIEDFKEILDSYYSHLLPWQRQFEHVSDDIIRAVVLHFFVSNFLNHYHPCEILIMVREALKMMSENKDMDKLQ